MTPYYLGCDVSKGYADFVIIDKNKQPMVKNFQLDDTFDGHHRLFQVISQFLTDHPKSVLYAAMESTGGYENNWYNTLTKFQAVLEIKTARLNPLAVLHHSKADLKRNKTDKSSAHSIAEYLVAHPDKVSYQQQDQMAGLESNGALSGC